MIPQSPPRNPQKEAHTIKKIKKVIQATANSYLSIMTHAYTQTHHSKSGTCRSSLQLHVIVISFLGKYNDSFGRSFRLGSTYFICLSFHPSPYVLTKKKKNSTSDAYSTRFLHYTRIFQGSSLDPPPPNRRKDEPLLQQQPPPTYPIWCHKKILMCFFSPY